MTTTTNTSDLDDFLDVLALLFDPPTMKTAENDFPTFVKAVEILKDDVNDTCRDEILSVVTAALADVLAKTLKRWPSRHQSGTVADVVRILYDAVGAEIEIYHADANGKELSPA
jgi:hypothetical protein